MKHKPIVRILIAAFFIVTNAYAQNECDISDKEILEIKAAAKNEMEWKESLDKLVVKCWIIQTSTGDSLVAEVENKYVTQLMEANQERGGRNLVKLVFDSTQNKLVKFVKYQ